MKIETDDNTLWVFFWLGVATVLVALILTSRGCYEAEIRRDMFAITNGMTQVRNPDGRGVTVWVRPETLKK